MLPPINRQDRPPRDGPELWIKRLKANERVFVCILSTSLWGTWTHWNGQSSDPCYANKAKCPGCRKGQPIRWKGYLHVYDMHRKQDYLLELPPGAAAQVLDVLGENQPLRGERINIERQNGKKARLKITPAANHSRVSDVPLPAAKDPYKSLCRMWGTDECDVDPIGQPSIPLAG